MNNRVSRNAPCPCGSSRKYKHCCGSYTATHQPRQDERRLAFLRAIAANEAKEARRRQQQGLGRPIISTEFAGHRIVAVGNTVHWSNNGRRSTIFSSITSKTSLAANGARPKSGSRSKADTSCSAGRTKSANTKRQREPECRPRRYSLRPLRQSSPHTSVLPTISI
jgi:hypothetical protein